MNQLRSINLAVSDRGLNALQCVDPALCDRVMAKVIPMSGRMIHSVSGSLDSQQYGLHGEAINSIDRNYLNNLLLDELDRLRIPVQFEHKLASIRTAGQPAGQPPAGQPVLEFSNGATAAVDTVIGADGAFSKVRQQLERCVRMDFSKEYIDCAYIELSIPPGPKGEFALDKNHLHIWPRDRFMLIALPNLDGSFTSTLFGPWELLESLQTDAQITQFFETHFPDALGLIGRDNLLRCIHNNPKGQLLSVTCSPYHYQDKILLVGDAAHAMVPFYGQGMNCGFEDVFVLTRMLQHGSTQHAFEQYSATRHKDLVAIINLAKDNYNEMSHKVNSKWFLLKKKIDFALCLLLKDRWLPLYTMVSFRSDIPYSEAVARARRQDRLLGLLQNGVLGAAGGAAALLAWHMLKKP